MGHPAFGKVTAKRKADPCGMTTKKHATATTKNMQLQLQNEKQMPAG
jgi:hypothetical protein